jgi:hypothetical protein
MAACAARSLIAAEAKPALVEHRDGERESGDPIALADRSEVGRGHGGEDAARARRQQVRAVGPGDLLRRIECLDDRRAVRVDIPITMPSLGIAPRDREDLLALLQEVLDHAAPGSDVHDVVLVDDRRDHQQRDGTHLRCLRRVVDQLERPGLQHHRPLGGGDGFADGECVGIHHGRDPGLGQHVAGEGFQPAHGAQSAGVDHCFPADRAEQRVVGRRQPLDDVVEDEPHRLRVAPIQLRVAQQRVGRLRRGQVRLHCSLQQGISLPCRIDEAFVTLRGDTFAGPDGDRAQFAGQGGAAVSEGALPFGEIDPEAGPGSIREHAAGESSGGVGQQQVQRCGEFVGARDRVRHDCVALSVVGTVTSRRRILPVAPFGRLSTIHTRRGYL